MLQKARCLVLTLYSLPNLSLLLYIPVNNFSAHDVGMLSWIEPERSSLAQVHNTMLKMGFNPKSVALNCLTAWSRSSVCNVSECLTAGTCLTADLGVTSLIPARSHTFMEIDREIISMAILLPSAGESMCTKYWLSLFRRKEW